MTPPRADETVDELHQHAAEDYRETQANRDWQTNRDDADTRR
ncbi:hypothetical protein ABZ508_02675 [Streptomyces lavendulocolor]|uniref:Uncharacterized protein n=1 Tax=Streptomyces lavendulocolor TaxID=67316 RepID=A0ABV2VYA5_9ACTN